MERKEVPKDKQVIPSVWSMKRKRDIKTCKVTKYKARLIIHSSKQVYGKDYYETFSIMFLTGRAQFVLLDADFL